MGRGGMRLCWMSAVTHTVSGHTHCTLLPAHTKREDRTRQKNRRQEGRQTQGRETGQTDRAISIA